MNLIKNVMVILSGLSIASCDPMDDWTKEVEVHGYVYEEGTNTPLENVTVELGYYGDCFLCSYPGDVFNRIESTLTDSKGYYFVSSNLDEDKYYVHVSLSQFHGQEAAISYSKHNVQSFYLIRK